MATAVGVHVFAGGFTCGVKDAGFDVKAQLESSNFGQKTIESCWDVSCIIKHNWREWPIIQCDLVYGNPRCSGFSGLMLGYKHQNKRVLSGADACQGQDIIDLVSYALQIKQCKVIIFESVQQLYTSDRNREMIRRVERMLPNWRVCHVLMNAASFNVPQIRKRYFFIAYKGATPYDILPPTLTKTPSIDCTIQSHYFDVVNFVNLDKRNVVYLGNSAQIIPERYRPIINVLPQGYDINKYAKEFEDQMEILSEELYCKWLSRNSEEPFGRFGPMRLVGNKPMGVLAGSGVSFIHPTLNRTLTIDECAKIMGWPCIPKGDKPFYQLTKGVVPAAGAWIATQALRYMNEACTGPSYEGINFTHEYL